MSTTVNVTANQIRAFLVSRINNTNVPHTALISYGELCRAFNLPSPTKNWKAHPLSSIFDQLDTEDGMTRPFITAFVINKNSGYVLETAGFWIAYADHRKIVVPVLDRPAVWYQEFLNGFTHYTTP